MKPRYLWLIVLAAVVGAALLTATAAASAAAVLGGDARQADPQQQGAPPPPPPPPPPTEAGGPPPPPPPPPGRGGLDRLLWALDLAQPQIEQLKALREAARTASEPFEEQVGKAEEGIRAAVESGSFDEEAIRALVVSQSKAMAELRLIQARADAGILRLLTPEQREALKSARPPNERPQRRRF